MLESAIEKALVDGVERLGGQCLKLVLLNRMGWPDRTIFLRGRVYLVELKRPKKLGSRVSAQQQYWRRILEKCGFKIHVLWTLSEVKDFVSSINY